MTKDERLQAIKVLGEVLIIIANGYNEASTLVHKDIYQDYHRLMTELITTIKVLSMD
jgi:hypothetical protein